MGEPTYLGTDIHEHLWPLGIPVIAAGDDGKPIKGALFVRPEDGSVVFRQTTEERQDVSTS